MRDKEARKSIERIEQCLGVKYHTDVKCGALGSVLVSKWISTPKIAEDINHLKARSEAIEKALAALMDHFGLSLVTDPKIMVVRKKK